MMNIEKAVYIVSSPSVDKCPAADKPEYAFIGRSNVGKSSLINMLTNRHKLAKTSNTPGKTQMINHFEIKNSAASVIGQKTACGFWYIVDLPGYGFAKVSQQQRKQWEKMIADYLKTRSNLVMTFVLIDVRHKPQAIDIAFLNKLGEWQVPFALIFTKTDKVAQQEVFGNMQAFLKTMEAYWDGLPDYFITSAIKKTGRDKILSYIQQLNEGFALSL